MHLHDTPTLLQRLGFKSEQVLCCCLKWRTGGFRGLCTGASACEGMSQWVESKPNGSSIWYCSPHTTLIPKMPHLPPQRHTLLGNLTTPPSQAAPPIYAMESLQHCPLEMHVSCSAPSPAQDWLQANGGSELLR